MNYLRDYSPGVPTTRTNQVNWKGWLRHFLGSELLVFGTNTGNTCPTGSIITQYFNFWCGRRITLILPGMMWNKVLIISNSNFLNLVLHFVPDINYLCFYFITPLLEIPLLRFFLGAKIFELLVNSVENVQMKQHWTDTLALSIELEVTFLNLKTSMYRSLAVVLSALNSIQNERVLPMILCIRCWHAL